MLWSILTCFRCSCLSHDCPWKPSCHFESTSKNYKKTAILCSQSSLQFKLAHNWPMTHWKPSKPSKLKEPFFFLSSDGWKMIVANCPTMIFVRSFLSFTLFISQLKQIQQIYFLGVQTRKKRFHKYELLFTRPSGLCQPEEWPIQKKKKTASLQPQMKINLLQHLFCIIKKLLKSYLPTTFKFLKTVKPSSEPPSFLNLSAVNCLTRTL